MRLTRLSQDWHQYRPRILLLIIIILLTARVVGAPQMILQPLFSIFPCSPLPTGTCRTPGLSIPTSSIVRLVFFPLSLCLAGWFWPHLMSGKHDHTTAVCISLRSLADLHVVQLPAGSWQTMNHEQSAWWTRQTMAHVLQLLNWHVPIKVFQYFSVVDCFSRNSGKPPAWRALYTHIT